MNEKRKEELIDRISNNMARMTLIDLTNEISKMQNKISEDIMKLLKIEKESNSLAEKNENIF